MTINYYVKCHPDLFKLFFTALRLLCVCVFIMDGVRPHVGSLSNTCGAKMQ